MTVYVWRDGGFFDKATGLPMLIPERKGVCIPHFMADIEDYASPVDGKRVSSRSGQREDLKRTGCVLAPPHEPREFINPHFMKKRGIRPDGKPINR